MKPVAVININCFIIQLAAIRKLGFILYFFILIFEYDFPMFKRIVAWIKYECLISQFELFHCRGTYR